MKRTMTLVMLGSTLALAISLVSAHPDDSRPTNVAASAWIPLAADAGFVVTDSSSQLAKLGAAPTVSGYLMARRDGKWVRLEVEGRGRLVEAK